MKKFSIFIALAFFVIPFFAYAQTPPLPGYELAWNDEFNGSALDSTKWTTHGGPRRSAINTPAAVSMQDGALTITTYTEAGTHYTGFISTKGKYYPRYGYMEARINFNDSPGEWSAFWLQSPTIGNPTGNPSVAGTEIDIVEHRKVTDTIDISNKYVMNLHWAYDGSSSLAGPLVSPPVSAPSLQGNYHIYALKWTPTSYTFYLDGQEKWTTNTAVANCSCEFIFLTSEVQSIIYWGGDIPASGYGPLATSTTKMKVDWVRVWQPAPINYLTIQNTGTGMGITNPLPGVHSYTQGAVIGLTATPQTGSVFSGWSGDPDCADGSVTMNADKTCVATFTLSIPPSTKFSIGETVITNSSVNVRSLPLTSFSLGIILGVQPTGVRGTVVGGPTYANGYWWWQIDYDSGADGWSFESNLNKVTDTTPPVISSVSSSGITANSATITWITDEGATSQVDYGLTASYGNTSALISALSTSHSVVLSSLVGGTTYHYRIKSKDAAGNLAVSPDSVFSTSAVLADARPNIVVIMTDDQHDGDSLSVMTKVQNLLMAKGIRFINSFVDFPLCCPSRVSFLTGQNSRNHGIIGNGPSEGGGYGLFAPTAGNSLPVWLKSAGYYTGFIGKYPNGYGTEVPATVPPGWNRWFGLVDPYTYAFYNYKVSDNGSLITYGTAPTDYQTDVLAGKAVDFINARAGTSSPFFLTVAPLAPHTINYPAQIHPEPAPRHKGLFSTAPLPMPPSFNEANVDDKPAFLKSWPIMDSTKITYATDSYRLRRETLLAVDDMVERIVNTLQATGKLDNTIIVYTSDNGYFHGEHRKHLGKYWGYEESIRVPLIIRGPGISENQTRTHLVNNIDLVSTILDYANATPGRTQDGKSLKPVIVNPSAPWRTALFGQGIDSTPSVSPYGRYKMVRTNRYAYFEHNSSASGFEKELYDLQIDPYQLQNIAGQATYSTVEADLISKLTVLKTCAGASCWITSPELIPGEISPTLTLSANPSSITSGGSATLTWSSTNATSCTASGAWSGTKATSGTQVVTPTLTSTYILTCAGTGGSIVQSTTVTVTAVLPSIKFNIGDRVQTTATLNVRSTPSTSGTLLGTQPTGALGTVIGGSTYADSYHWWQINYDNAPDGWSVEDFLNKVTPIPILSLSANPSSITSGGSATLTWSSTNATSCTASGAWSGSKATSGTQIVNPTVTSTYTLTCTGSGGSVTQAVTVAVSTGTDTIAPTTYITTPTSGATVSGSSVTVNANASDNVGVAGVQFKLDGTNLGAEDTTSPYGITWNTTSASNGSHTLTAVARDAAGNIGTSGIVNVTVNNVSVVAPTITLSANPSSITSGGSATLTWSSTNATSCTASGAWSGSKALSGSQSTGTLTATSTFILSCAGSGGSVSKSATVAVFGYITPPSPGQKFSIGNKIQVTGSVLVRSSAGGTYITTKQPGQFGTVVGGPVSSWGYKWWKIDYDTDPDGWSIENRLELYPDVVPPKVSITYPYSNSLIRGTTTIWAYPTDNVKVGGVQFLVDGVELGAEDTSSPYFTYWKTAGFGDGLHSISATATDASGNASTSAPRIVTVDNTAPVISSVLVSGITDSGATITWITDEQSTSQVQYGKTSSYGFSSYYNFTPVTAHSRKLSNLTPGTAYYFRAVSRDKAGNIAYSLALTFTTGPDITPPKISLTSPYSGAILRGTTTIYAYATDNARVERVQFRLNGNNLGSEDTVYPFSMQWKTFMNADGEYEINAIARDTAGNASTSQSRFVKIDNTVPVISSVAISNITSADATITWTTNEPTNHQVQYGKTSAYGSYRSGYTKTIPHTQILSYLLPNTLYHFRIRAMDAVGNVALSENMTFTTAP